MSGYITATDIDGPIHFQPNPATPTTACGVDFTGKLATTHPITDGAAFTCVECAAAWHAARTAPPSYSGTRSDVLVEYHGELQKLLDDAHGDHAALADARRQIVERMDAVETELKSRGFTIDEEGEVAR